ncbi:MAG: aldo/keto reductase [Pseudohongiellaceae bacterium]
MLPKRSLGLTGIDVSCLGLGTVKFGRNQGVKYPTGFDLPDDAAVVALLDLARRLGINLIDTAPAYGTSEQRLGKLLVDRGQWVLCSKVGEEFIGGKSTYDFSGSHVQQSVERSLRHLNTDYLDIVLVHSNGNDSSIITETDCFATLQRLKEKGLVRAIGMSSKTVAGGLLALDLSDVVMVTCNPGEREDLPVIARAHDLGKGVLVKKALASGHLGSAAGTDAVLESIGFVLGQPGVTSIIVGTINPAHLQHNVDCAEKALAARE